MQAITFISTRNSGVAVDIAHAIAEGMPADGGLYVPTSIPSLPSAALHEQGLSYAELAWIVLAPWFADWQEHELRPLIEEAYDTSRQPRFFVPDVAPVRPAGSFGNHPAFCLELFHGRTCAFKDFALSLLGGLLEASMERCGMEGPLCILTATSGDTGSAALEGLGGRRAIRIAVLYPAEGTSEIQRLQMTSVPSKGRLVLGLLGNFDDAQREVKRIFRMARSPESPFHTFRLSSANSINIGRLLPQIVYYVHAWRKLRELGALKAGEYMHVVVPSGNFGDILAARYAKAMGLPIETLVVASNANRVLADFFATGRYDRRRPFFTTLSPSMDILISSNLERLLYMAMGENPVRLAAAMATFEKEGVLALAPAEHAKLADFRGGWADDHATRLAIRSAWEEHRLLLDPHTAVGYEVARQITAAGQWSGRGTEPVVLVATASPFKFPVACFEALSLPVPSEERPQGKVAASAPQGTEHTGSDLALAAQLASCTGIPMPRPLAELGARPVQHTRVCEVQEAESLLAEFFRRETQGGAA